MPRAKLTVTVPEETWIGDLSRRHSDARFRILAAISSDEDGVGLVEITSPSVEAIVTALGGYDAVTDVECLYRQTDEALVQFATTDPLLLLPAQGSGIPLEMPIELVDGDAVIEVTAPHERLSELGMQLDFFDISFSVEYIQEQVPRESLLTDRQRRFLTAAVEAGYYDTPRDCTLTALAEELDVAKSTASETLHRAEGAVIKQFVESLAPIDG